ncbi:PIR protein [Plasmodium ovale]|uniref:PIR Superfamily Protein n=2 Tax=Plasmodium ovale TaxID=36330 RepID=A0A1A8X2S6_PLAOA|nr:PIR Superfamily Protein [Plasmodium ovale curtisi]SBS99528.1 PIR Superfamily Protein [Plasmodium ovale curtisi]SBT85097.1 PIR protein [Plasmodium ovale]
MALGQPHRVLGSLFGRSTELFSEQFYQDREYDQYNLSEYNNLCKELFAPKHTSRMLKLCKRIVKYLDKYSFRNDDISLQQDCILLNYWVYDMLTRIFGADNQTDIRNAFGNLQYIWSYLVKDQYKTSYYKKCKPLFNEILNFDDWKQRKELYDYYVDYDTLFRTAMGYPEKCEEYYKKIDERTSLYKYFETKCLSDKYNCPEHYKNYTHYNPVLVLPQLPCHGNMVAAKQAIPRQQDLRQEQLDNSHSHYPNVELTKENSEIGKKVGHSVLGVAPFLLTATALYKYTPVGSWVRKISGYGSNSISGMDAGEMEAYSHNAQEFGDILFSDTGKLISYQPI